MSVVSPSSDQPSRAVALRELLAVGAEDHRQVRERGHGQPQRLVDEDLARGVRQVVVAADDVRDAHVRVVAHHGEVVGGASVGAHDDHVVHHFGGEAHVAVHGVVELDRAAVLGHAQAPHVRLAGFDAAGGLGGVEVAARAVVARVGPAGLLGRLALGVQLLLRAEAGVHAAAFLHALERRGVRVHALRLEVGAGLAAHLGALVPVEAEPLHGVEDDLHVLLGGALGVGVFDAQDEVAAHRAGERPVVDGRARATHVEAAGRGGCEAHAHARAGCVGHGEDPLHLVVHRAQARAERAGLRRRSRAPTTIASIDDKPVAASHTVPIPIQNSGGYMVMSSES